jgi:hypothetical protein
VISAPLPNLDTLDIEALKALVIAQHESSHQQIEHLKLVIEKYRRMLFGSKSEKLTGQLEQLEFQLEDWRRPRQQPKRHSPALLRLQPGLGVVLRASLCQKIFRVKSHTPAVQIVEARCVSLAKMFPSNWNAFRPPTR